MDNPILSDLNWRYTTKKYDPSKRVSQKDLDVLLEALRLSASSINSQPWKFIVLESNAAKERMNKTFINKHQYNQKHVFDSSQIILFAHNPAYTRDDYAVVVDKNIEDERVKPENREGAFAVYPFVELYTDEEGNNSAWTKAQLYLALGNTLHTLARLRIDSTPIEGIDIDLVNEEFKTELKGYQCDVALAIGYHHEEEDFNAKLPKSRLDLESVFEHL